MAKPFAVTLLGLAAVLVSAPSASAQDPAAKFQEAVIKVRIGKAEEALPLLQEILAEDPSNSECLAILRQTEAAVWSLMLKERDGDMAALSKYAQSILSRAQAAGVERSRDMEAAMALAKVVVEGDYAERTQAAVDLARQHGEFAVPALLPYLTEDNAESVIANAVQGFYELGRSGTMPLIAALDSEDEQLRRNVAAVLAQTMDERAAPRMAELAVQDSSEAVRAMAQAFLSKADMASAEPVALNLQRVRDLLTGRGLRALDASNVIWSWDGELVATDVPAGIYSVELAKHHAHAAVNVDPANNEARTLLAVSYLAQSKLIEAAIVAEEDEYVAIGSKLPALRMVALASGPDVLGMALNSSIDMGLVPVAVGAIECLADASAAADLGGSPLVAALDSSDSRISYAAALALVKAAKGTQLPAADKVVGTLAQAVSEETLRQILVIDSAPSARTAVKQASSNRGFEVGYVEAAHEAILQLSSIPVVDVVVINELLSDAAGEDVASMIRKNPRMANTAIVVVANDVDQAADKFGDKADAVIAGPLSGEALQQAVNDALDGKDIGWARGRADRMAVAASEALHMLANNNVNVGTALSSLAGQLNRADTVAIPAAKALAAGGNVDQLNDLAGAVMADSNSNELRIAAAHAVGAILARSQQDMSQDLLDQMLGAVANGSIDSDVRLAIATALGKARLAPGNRLQLVESLRTVGSSEG